MIATKASLEIGVNASVHDLTGECVLNEVGPTEQEWKDDRKQSHSRYCSYLIRPLLLFQVLIKEARTSYGGEAEQGENYCSCGLSIKLGKEWWWWSYIPGSVPVQHHENFCNVLGDVVISKPCALALCSAPWFSHWQYPLRLGNIRS